MTLITFIRFLRRRFPDIQVSRARHADDAPTFCLLSPAQPRHAVGMPTGFLAQPLGALIPATLAVVIPVERRRPRNTRQ